MKLIYDANPDQKHLDDKLMGFDGNKIKGYGFTNFIYKMTNKSGLMITGIDCIFAGRWLEIISSWVSKNHFKIYMTKRLA